MNTMGRHFVAGPAVSATNKKPPVTENGKIQPPPEKHPKRKKEKKSKDSKKRKLDTETKVNNLDIDIANIFLMFECFFVRNRIVRKGRVLLFRIFFLYCIRKF